MNTRLIMQSLPLVAAVLGNRYGVTVNIGGKNASTNGKTINLPALPFDCDETLVGLARGYIDHEAAHIRETDFKAIRDAQLTPFEMSIQNIFEDWRVEHRLAALFSGCRANFDWLIRHFFIGDNVDVPASLVALMHDWILLTVRSWDIPGVGKTCKKVQGHIEGDFPDLLIKLKSLLSDVKHGCNTTDDSIKFARDVSSILKDETTTFESGVRTTKPIRNNGKNTGSDGCIRGSINQDKLKAVLSASKVQLPKSLGEIISDTLVSSVARNEGRGNDRIHVAQVGKKALSPFPDSDLLEIKQVESVLKVRMIKALQAKQLKRGRLGRRGKIATRALAKTVAADPKIFMSREEKVAVNTAVHLLMDCSGSMRRRIDLTSKVCLGIAKSLEAIKGVSVAVTAFPTPRNNGFSVCPIVSHGAKVNSKFSTDCFGGTPMGESLYWVLQQLIQVSESRKIVLVVTDGQPDSVKSTQAAIALGKSVGVELYGIGIKTDSVKTLFPEKYCVVDQLSALVPAMQTLLSKTIIKS